MTQTDLFTQTARVKYPHAPGFKSRSTSQAAANETGPRAAVLRDACLAALTGADLTADEVAARLGESVLSIRPRISELAKMGKIADSGERRENDSGHRAIVWRKSA